jgi:hypothetical protein
MEIFLNDKTEFLIKLLSKGIDSLTAAGYIMECDAKGTAHMVYESTSYDVVREFDIGGYPFYTLTIGG